MIDYEWMVSYNDTASQVEKDWQNKKMRDFLYGFIYLCRMGFTEKELRGFVDVLLSNRSSKDR